MLRKLINSEDGVIISAELVLVLTIVVIGMVVGLSHVAMAVNQELTDVAEAIGALNQSYCFTGFTCCVTTNCPNGTAYSRGSIFTDASDYCDLSQNNCADIATCTPTVEVSTTGHGS